MSAQTHPATVLIIDDEVQIRRLLRRTLEPEGYKVLLVESGREGLAHTGTDRPDVVVLDLGLPDMDGLEVLTELRSGSSVPILILSVREAEETIVHALIFSGKCGARPTLRKRSTSGSSLVSSGRRSSTIPQHHAFFLLNPVWGTD